MRRPVVGVLATACLLGASTVPAAGSAPTSISAAPSATGTAAATASASHAVPPPAPTPTDRGRSPAAPDPHPRRGGIGPQGQAVGGSRLLSRTLVLPTGAPPLPQSLSAASWLLFDADTGDVLAARDPHGRYQPASILKTLTSITLLPLLPGKQTVTVSAAAAHAEGSAAGLTAGGTYTVDQLFEGLLLVSGNDSATALAEAAGGVRHTVDLMNRTALDLGAYDTYVQTPSGLDGWQQLTSAYDMAIFLRTAMNQPRFVAYDRKPTATLPVQAINGYGPVTLYNQNEQFLKTVPGALVAKTGFTDAAQHTFVGAIERHGHRYGVVFLRAQRWPKDQWQQARDLVYWGAALPPGTSPVGHLDPAPPAPVPVQSQLRRAGSLVFTGLGSPHDSGWLIWVLIGCGIAASGLTWRMRSALPRLSRRLRPSRLSRSMRRRTASSGPRAGSR